MARAVLQIDVDTSGVRRAMGDLRGTARTAQAAMTAEARRATAQRDRIARDETRFKQRMDIETVRSQRDADRARAQSATQASRERIAASNREARVDVARMQTTTQLFIASERAKTRAVEREEKQRTRAAQTEERARVSAARAAAREVTRTDRERTRAGRDIGYGLRRGLNVGGDAALNVGRVAYSQIRDERLQRAEANRGLTHALGGAGIRGFDAQAQRQVAAFAGQTGMSYGSVVDALVTGQQRGSALELRGRTPGAALSDALATVRQANATGTDAGNLLAARGRLGTAGISGGNLDEVMRFVQFAADRGSVEVDQIIQQGLPGALRLMSSRTAGVSPEHRQRAAVAAFRESVAVQEVMAGAGGRSGQVSNAYSGFQTALNTPRRQDLIRNNLTTYAQSLTGNDAATRARRAAVMGLVEGPNALYEDDPTRRGARRLRGDVENSPLALIDRVTQAMGGNSNAAANIFAGGGHGNAQGLLSNVRTLMGTLGAINPETGRTRSDSVREIMGGGYSAADLQGRQAAVESDDLATIRRNEAARAQAFTDTASAVVRFGRALDDFTARNPIGSAALQSGGGLLGGLLGGALFPRIGTALAGTRAGQAVLGLTGRAAALPGQIAGGAAGAGRAALGAAGALYAGLSFGGATSGTDFEENQRRAAATAEWVRSQGGMSVGNTTASRTPPTADEIGRAVATALQSSPLTIDPVTAAHAASQNATQPARRP